jgi:hypothetical protein
MSAVITGKTIPCTQSGLLGYYKYYTKLSSTRSHTYPFPLHTQNMVASTWLDDHQANAYLSPLIIDINVIPTAVPIFFGGSANRRN